MKWCALTSINEYQNTGTNERVLQSINDKNQQWRLQSYCDVCDLELEIYSADQSRSDE